MLTHADANRRRRLASLELARGSRQARGPRTSGAFTVAPGQQGLDVSASGSADGRVVVRDPRGRVVIDTDGLTGQTQERSGGRVLVGRSGNEAGGAVLAPAPGRWSVTTSGGTPFTDVRTTLVPRPGTELARVTPLGGSRTLRPGSAVRVRVTGPAGGRVQLRAARSGRASDIGRRLATVRPGIRIVRVPRDWAGTSLRLVAVTEQGGVPVGSTRAARALRIVAARRGAPGRPVVVRGPSSTTVRFAKAAGAARYVVRLTVAGRRYEKVSRSPLVVLRVPTRGRTATVRVTPVGADGRYGPARTRVVR